MFTDYHSNKQLAAKQQEEIPVNYPDRCVPNNRLNRRVMGFLQGHALHESVFEKQRDTIIK